MVADAGTCAPGRTVPAHQRQQRGQRSRPRTNAFTLLEILLALALLGLLSAALISGAAHLVSSRPQSPQEVFWEAARTARRAALNAQHEVTLRFDEKEKSFVLNHADAEQSFPVPAASRELSIDFLRAQVGGSSVLIGGQLVDTATVTSVSFYGDGTCTPFRIQFRGTSAATILAIDPWTCAPVLTEEKTP